MTSLGQWEPYINEEEIRSWYTLPGTMEAECELYVPNGRELDPIKGFSSLERRTIQFVDRSVAGFRNPYHKPKVHFRTTRKLGLAAADAYAGRNRRRMPIVVRQAFGLALYAHDTGHCGATFRADSRKGLYRPDLNGSAEWVSATAVNEFMEEEGLILPARLFQVGVIFASTYGDNTPRGQSLGIPSTIPTTVWGAIMRAADACPPSSFEPWIRESVAINYGEIPAMSAPRTMDEFVANRRAFLDYVDSLFDNLDAIAGSICGSLGWRGRLDTMRTGLDTIEAGDVTMLRNELRRYRVSLT